MVENRVRGKEGEVMDVDRQKMRGRSMEREGGLPRALRPGEDQGDRPVPRPSDARDWHGVGRREKREPLREQRALRPGDDQVHRQDQFGLEWDAAVRRSGILGAGGQKEAEVDGSGGDASRRWTWAGNKVWVPERAQRADEDDELIGEMDLAEDMERNYGLACRKLQGMEKQREYLFGVIKNLRGEVRKWQESTWFWKKRYEQAEQEKFETPAAEVFETPIATAIV